MLKDDQGSRSFVFVYFHLMMSASLTAASMVVSEIIARFFSHSTTTTVLLDGCVGCSFYGVTVSLINRTTCSQNQNSDLRSVSLSRYVSFCVDQRPSYVRILRSLVVGPRSLQCGRVIERLVESRGEIPPKPSH